MNKASNRVRGVMLGFVLFGVEVVYWRTHQEGDSPSASKQGVGKTIQTPNIALPVVAEAVSVSNGGNSEKPVQPDPNTFELPFLRKVTALPRNEQVTIPSKSGSPAQLKMKVFYSKEGFFIRAEGGTVGGPPEKITVEEIEELWVTGDHSKITGIPDVPPKESLSEVLAVIAEEVDLEHVLWIECSYVMYRYLSDEVPHPEYICSVWADPKYLYMDSGRDGYMSINYDPASKRKMFSNYR